VGLCGALTGNDPGSQGIYDEGGFVVCTYDIIVI
jgi:hypothetical protein